MRLCIVGNGPSAAGKASEIDRCDFVVRMNDFWRCGAEDSGDKLDAHAYFEPWDGWEHAPRDCEHWLTQSPKRIRGQEQQGRHKLEFFAERVSGHVVRWLTNHQWDLLSKYLQAHPSSGFVTVAMALWAYPKASELVLYGFDSTRPDRPNFFDAREDGKERGYVVHHAILREKQAIAEIRGGSWLGKPTSVTLTWPDMPMLEEHNE